MPVEPNHLQSRNGTIVENDKGKTGKDLLQTSEWNEAADDGVR